MLKPLFIKVSSVDRFLLLAQDTSKIVNSEAMYIDVTIVSVCWVVVTRAGITGDWCQG